MMNSKSKKTALLLAALSLFGVIAGYLVYQSMKVHKTEALVLNVTDADFTEKVVDQQGLVVVDLHAEWCNPCHIMTPRIKQLAGDYEGKASFVFLDFDQAQETVGKLGYELIPTIYMFYNGDQVYKQGGIQSVEELSRNIERILNNQPPQNANHGHVGEGEACRPPKFCGRYEDGRKPPVVPI